MTIKLLIATPDKLNLDMEVSLVVIPGINGEFGVMKDHLNFSTAVKPGLLKIYDENNKLTEEIFVSDGFVEVKDNIIHLLVMYSAHINELDAEILMEKIEYYKNELLSDDMQYKTAYLKKQISNYEYMLDVLRK